MLMRIIKTIAAILISVNLFGQDLKQIITTYPKTEFVNEVYFVQKNNKEIKHGDYYSFHKGYLTKKQLKDLDLKDEMTRGFNEKGQYKNNLKEGYWEIYGVPKKSKNSITYWIATSGNYLNGNKVGIWNTYAESFVTKRYDFDNNKELEPIITAGIAYPSEARKNRVEGIVTIKIQYKDCEPTAYEILKDLGYGCGDAAIKGLKEKFRLQKKYGVNTSNCDKTEETLDITFKLNE